MSGCRIHGASEPGELKGRKIDMIFLGKAFEADWDEAWEEVLRERKRGPVVYFLLKIFIKDVLIL